MLKRFSVRHALVLLTLLAVLLRLVWGVSRYQADPLNVNFGDYDLYEYGAEHVLAEGDFTNSLFLVRPPLFPLMIAALGMNRLVVLVVNAIIGGLITPLTYGIARRLGLSESLSLGAAFFLAVDFVAIAYGSALLDPIALGNLFAILMIFFLLLIPDAESRRAAVGYGAAAGLALVISAMARPEIYLIWTGLGVWLLVIARRHWRAVATYAVISVVGLGVWTVHNGLVFGHYSLSTVSGFTMAFYRAASVERIGSGNDIETVYMDITYRVEEKIGNDPAAATADTRWGYHAASPEIEDALFAVSREIFFEYPLIYLVTFPVGFIRMYALTPPFLSSTGNAGWMYAPFIWNWLFFVAATTGLVLAAIQQRWRLFWCAFLVAGYYTTGTLLVKNAGLGGRERAILTPFMAITAVITVQYLFRRLQQRSNVLQKPSGGNHSARVTAE